MLLLKYINHIGPKKLTLVYPHKTYTTPSVTLLFRDEIQSHKITNNITAKAYSPNKIVTAKA